MEHERITLESAAERQEKGIELASRLTEFLLKDLDDSQDEEYSITIIVMAVATFMAGLIDARFEKSQHQNMVDNFKEFINKQLKAVADSRSLRKNRVIK
jgi:hypothetical protein